MSMIVIATYIISCNSSNKRLNSNKNGYVKIYDTIINSNSTNMREIFRTFYQKTPTIHNEFIQIKQSVNDSNIYFETKVKETNKSVRFRINNFDTFLDQTDYVINSNLDNITLALDSLEQTYMRKSLSFDEGMFVIHIYDNNKNVLFDLSKDDIDKIKKAYSTYLNE